MRCCWWARPAAANARLRAYPRRRILCEGREKPCGVCRHCRKVMAGTHPDVVLHDCADTEAGGHRMETLREEILGSIAAAPNEADRRVYILANIESLSYGTPNILLKTLEEPPAHVAFILTASSRELLLETILSRVVTIRNPSPARRPAAPRAGRPLSRPERG